MAPRQSTIAPTPTELEARRWAERTESDAALIFTRVPDHLIDVHLQLTSRAQEADASALILSGSTARGCRTDISDLDYHLIGDRVETADLSHELDVHVLSPVELEARLTAGDDFVHWSLRYGLVVFDSGPARAAAARMTRDELWPDPVRKARHATRSLDLAARFVTTGDLDGATVQVRTALSLAARAHLLERHVFPLSRAELPGQLADAGQDQAAAMLSGLIRSDLELDELESAVAAGRSLLTSK